MGRSVSPEEKAEAATVEMAVETTSSACQRGYVRMARDMARDCIDQCQSSCSALGSVISTYMTRGKAAAYGSVCQNKWAFKCFVQPHHVGACHVFFVKARQFGFALPSSESDLDRQCSRMLLAANASSLEAEELPSVKASSTTGSAKEDVAIGEVTKESEQPSPVLLEASVETASSA